MLDAAFVAFAYMSAIVATLRAGSRMMYMMGNGGVLGRMDGPLILGPQALQEPSRTVETEEIDSSVTATARSIPGIEVHNESDIKEKTTDNIDHRDEASKVSMESVSSLWEVAHCFEAAVKFAVSSKDAVSTIDERNDHTKQEVTDDSTLNQGVMTDNAIVARGPTNEAMSTQPHLEYQDGPVTTANEEKQTEEPRQYLMSTMGYTTPGKETEIRQLIISVNDNVTTISNETIETTITTTTTRSLIAPNRSTSTQMMNQAKTYAKSILLAPWYVAQKAAKTSSILVKYPTNMAKSAVQRGYEVLKYPTTMAKSAVKESYGLLKYPTNLAKATAQRGYEMVQYGMGRFPSMTFSSWRRMVGVKRRRRVASREIYVPKHGVDYSKLLQSKTTTVDMPSLNKNEFISDGTTSPPLSGAATTTRSARLTIYAADLFAELRSRYFAIDPEDFVQSLQQPFVSFQSNSKGAARSGGYFFFSRDGAYMVKSIKKEEAETLLEILPLYHAHMKRHSRRSLLGRICGLYEISIPSSPSPSGIVGDLISSATGPIPGVGKKKEEKHVLMVTNAVFPAEASQFISERFDLKGATWGRECSIEEKQTKKSLAVLKDLDLANESTSREPTSFREMEQEPLQPAPQAQLTTRLSQKHHQHGLYIGPVSRAALLSQLRKDVAFLVQCNVMDYSLLVGVVNMEDSFLPRLQRATTQRLAQLGRLRRNTQSTPTTTTTTSSAHFSVRNLASAVPNEVKSMAALPLLTLTSPPLLIAQKLFSLLDMTFSTVLTLPLPYYGAGICGVDGGALSVLHGQRRGQRAVYYLGIIDFLQPWSRRKILERELKGMVGFDKSAISCVSPEEYGERFLKFLAAHIT